MSIHPYLSEFEECLIASGYSDTAVSGYLIDVGMFISWIETRLSRDFEYSIMSESIIEKHTEYLVGQANQGKYKLSTISRKFQAIRCFLSWAKEKEYMDYQLVNPTSGLKLDSSETVPLTKIEQQQLVDAMVNDLRIAKIRYKKRWVGRVRDCSMVLFMLNTGLKMEELLSLVVTDIALKGSRGTVSVNGSRVVPLNSIAQKAVSEWLSVRPQDNNEFLWVAVENEQEGAALSTRSFQRIVKRIGQDAGIENLTPLKLRMTFGCNIADGGTDPLTLAQLMGVSSLNSVRSFYKHAAEKGLEKAVNGLHKKHKANKVQG